MGYYLGKKTLTLNDLNCQQNKGKELCVSFFPSFNSKWRQRCDWDSSKDLVQPLASLHCSFCFCACGVWGEGSQAGLKSQCRSDSIGWSHRRRSWRPLSVAVVDQRLWYTSRVYIGCPLCLVNIFKISSSRVFRKCKNFAVFICLQSSQTARCANSS